MDLSNLLIFSITTLTNEYTTNTFRKGVRGTIYAGFWSRFGSMLLDFLFVVPVTALTLYLNSVTLNAYFCTIIPSLAFSIWYHVYLPKKYGGTPGKLLSGISIIRVDGDDIDWKEAFLRHSVMLGLIGLSVIIIVSGIWKADEKTYQNLGFFKKSEYLMSFSSLATVYLWATNIWVYGELVVMLTNKRRRALHDFMAGTVVVKTVYIPRIREEMIGENSSRGAL